MNWLLLPLPVANIVESFVDNVILDKVENPIIGSVLYCDLAFGYAEHTGIYVGEQDGLPGSIVQLSRSGIVELVSPHMFIDGKSAMNIYVSCDDNLKAVGSNQVARRAIKQVGERRDYSLLLDNCHQFTAGCLNKDFENACNFLWMVKEEAKRHIGATAWRVWDVNLFSKTMVDH